MFEGTPRLNRRTIIRAFALAAGSLTLAACGQSSIATPTTAPATTPVPGAPPAATAVPSKRIGTGKTEIVLAHYLDPAANAVYDTEIKALTDKFPDISVRQDVSPEGEFTGKMLTQFGGGNYPDVIMLTDRYVPDFASRDVLLLLDPYIKKDAAEVNIDDMNKDLVQSGNWQGKQYGLFDYTGPLIMYINKRLWKEAGVEVPTGELPGQDLTFDQLAALGEKLTRGSGPTKVYGCDASFLSNFCILTFVAWSFGTEIIPGRGPHSAAEAKFKWDTPQMRTALQMLGDWTAKSAIQPKPGEIQGDSFQNQRVAIKNFSGRWLTPAYSKLSWVDDLGMMMAPTGPTGVKQSRNGPRGLFSPKGTKHPEEAWQLIKFINSPEAERIAFQGQYSTPPRHSLWDDFAKTKMPWENVAIYKKSQEIMEAGGALPTYPKFGAMNKIISDQLAALQLGKQNIGDTVKQMDEQMNAEMSGPV
jgi:multiple sugar transport system substrate-binding protein